MIAAALLLATAAPSAAAVEEARTSLVEMADKAFLAFWAANEARAAQVNISATATRQMMRWVAPGYSMGMCADYLKPTEKADWTTKLDQMVFAVGDSGQDLMRAIRGQGDRLFQQGQSDTSLRDRTPAQRARFCATELAGVRAYLASI